MAEKLLTVRQVQSAGEGDHSDGGGLMLRVRGVSASWVLRYTSASGRRREMGLGAARRGNSKDTGDSLTATRDAASKARVQLQAGQDLIEERQRLKAAARAAETASKAQAKREQLTLARAATEEMLQVAWCVFRDDYLTGKNTGKTQKDWPAHFSNSVRRGWYKLWYTGDQGVCWTSNGQQEKSVLEARQQAKGATHAPA
jgi:hypothetical protein